MEDGLYMGRAEQRCLEEVKLRYDKNEIRYYGISIEEQQQLHVLIDTAQDTDGETTTFPDFIGENGWIEHFQVSSSKCNRKGNENNRKIASINRAIEKQIEDSINKESLIHPFSSSFCFNKDSLANYHKSFEDNWEKHYAISFAMTNFISNFMSRDTYTLVNNGKMTSAKKSSVCCKQCR